MAADLIVAPRRRLDAPPSFLPGVGMLGFTLRGGFILLLAILAARATLPQKARLRAVHEAPADLLRVVLGAIVFAWVLWQSVALGERAGAYRASLRIALAGVPLALIFVIAIR
jgi:hypothetical protein